MALSIIYICYILFSVGQIEILTFNLLNFKVLAKRHQQSFPINKFETFQTEGIFIRNILKKCIVHHTAIIRYLFKIKLLNLYIYITLNEDIIYYVCLSVNFYYFIKNRSIYNNNRIKFL